MRAIAPLTTLVLLALLGGCGDTATMIAANPPAAQLPRSKYQPLLVSEADIDAFLATAKAESGKVVRDDLGVYFHEVKATRINSVALQKEDEVALKGLLSSSIGLLEPVYSFEPTGSIKLDWPETERRHAFLTKKVGLRLAPLPASRTYHERIEAAAVLEPAACRTPGGQHGPGSDGQRDRHEGDAQHHQQHRPRARAGRDLSHNARRR